MVARVIPHLRLEYALNFMIRNVDQTVKPTLMSVGSHGHNAMILSSRSNTAGNVEVQLRNFTVCCKFKFPVSKQ